MVSASHNPARDNGLKVLDDRGLKLDEGVEDELEQLIWTSEELPSASAEASGLAIQDRGCSTCTSTTGSAWPRRRRPGCIS